MESCDVVSSREYFGECIPVLRPKRVNNLKSLQNCWLQQEHYSFTKQKDKINSLSSRLCDDSLQFFLCSRSAESYLYSCRAQEMSLTQNLNNVKSISRGKKKGKKDTVCWYCAQSVHSWSETPSKIISNAKFYVTGGLTVYKHKRTHAKQISPFPRLKTRWKQSWCLLPLYRCH